MILEVNAAVRARFKSQFARMSRLSESVIKRTSTTIRTIA